MRLLEPIEYSKNLCYCCLNHNENINTYKIVGRGEGSLFQGCLYMIQLCDECREKFGDIETWCSENKRKLDDVGITYYAYEEELADMLSSFPLVAKELIMNSKCISPDVKFEPSDWLEIQLGTKRSGDVMLELGAEKLINLMTTYHEEVLDMNREGIPSEKIALQNCRTINSKNQCVSCELVFNPLKAKDLREDNFLLLTLEDDNFIKHTMGLGYKESIQIRDYLNRAIDFFEKE